MLVFTKTKHGANRLAEQLGKDGIEAMAIHGNKSQGARTRALAQFKDGSLPVLVATDIAARGLDIDDLPHVVNYELPHVPEDYVHRIGRTGRAGREGSAVSLVDRDEVKLLDAIERVIKRTIERVEVDGFTGLQRATRRCRTGAGRRSATTRQSPRRAARRPPQPCPAPGPRPDAPPAAASRAPSRSRTGRDRSSRRVRPRARRPASLNGRVRPVVPRSPATARASGALAGGK